MNRIDSYCSACGHMSFPWSSWSDQVEVEPGVFARARYLAADIPDPDSFLGAGRRVSDAIAALWWEIVYATKLDLLVDWITRKLRL